MLDESEIKEIRNFLENSSNPLFFFDNDADGLCSFAILQRAIQRGYGVPIKTYPDLSVQYIRKVNELSPDAIFVLDKAEISKEFIEEVYSRNIPIVWIDHHPSKTPEHLIQKTNYYNSGVNCEPVTYIAQKIFNRQEDLILALIGCISDVYMPDFAEKISSDYPELFNANISAFDALHKTEIGKIVRMLNFGLMDTTTNVIKLMKFICSIKSPYDFFEENSRTRDFHKRYSTLNKELDKLITKANKVNRDPKILFFSYEGQTSMSAILSNQLYFENKDKTIIVAYKRPDKVNLSIRGKNALEITKAILEKIDGATGGGHKEATGAMISIGEFENLKIIIKELQDNV